MGCLRTVENYGCVEPDGVLRDHGCDGFVRAVAAVKTGREEACMSAAVVFKSVDSFWHVELKITAARAIDVYDNGHAVR